jgi:hypothetical protein
VEGKSVSRLTVCALEIQAAEAIGEWEPKGKRLEYIDIDIALMRELGRGFWGVSVLDVDENAKPRTRSTIFGVSPRRSRRWSPI